MSVKEIMFWMMIIFVAHDLWIFIDTSSTVISLINQCNVVSEIALSRYNSDVPNCAFPEFNEWDIVEPRGIPQFGHSLNSGLWVTEWINMQNVFNNQILGMMDETWARMKIAMRLLLGAHNECKQMLLTDANQFWHDVMDGPYSINK